MSSPYPDGPPVMRRASTIARIVWDVVAYRLRRLEMANMAGAASIMLVLGLALDDFARRAIVAALLNVLVYLNNDYHDVRQDLSASGRDLERTRFLAAHLPEARAAQALLALAVLGWGSRCRRGAGSGSSRPRGGSPAGLTRLA